MLKKKSRSRKILFIVSAVLFVVFIAAVVVGGVWYWKYRNAEKNPSTTEKPIVYYPADYEKDILQDQVYLAYDRDLYYTNGSVTMAYNENDRDIASEECLFFLDYFHSVITGDYESYPSYFVADYFEISPKFTMQMIYDLQVTVHSISTVTLNGTETTAYNFVVRYKIHRNNGTFRTGIYSDTAVPQVYQLVRDAEGKYRIYDILKVGYE